MRTFNRYDILQTYFNIFDIQVHTDQTGYITMIDKPLHFFVKELLIHYTCTYIILYYFLTVPGCEQHRVSFVQTLRYLLPALIISRHQRATETFLQQLRSLFSCCFLFFPSSSCYNRRRESSKRSNA